MHSINTFIYLFFVLALAGCKDQNYELDTLTAPSNLEVNVVIEEGETGNVMITPAADNALYYHVYFNLNGSPRVIQAGETATYRYTKPGEYEVPINVIAYGTGGTATSKSVTLDMNVRLIIDQDILNKIAGNGSKTWIWNSTENAHFGVGPTDSRGPDYYTAGAGILSADLYDDEMTFSYDAQSNYTYNYNPGPGNNTFMNWTEVTRFFPSENPGENEDQAHDIREFINQETRFAIFERDGSLFLNMGENTVLSYYDGVQEYEIMELTDSKLVVRGVQNVRSEYGGGALAWYYTFVPRDGSTGGGDTGGGDNGGIDSNYNTLVFSDEFNTPGLPNSDNWGYDIGTGDNGWGNNEEQYYTNRAENAQIIDTTLVITLKKENYNGSQYTSARLLSRNKFEFTYGRVEFRAKLPSGGGTWPALWMLGANFTEVGWPACGEIDVMEHVGNSQNNIHSTLHYPNHFGGNGVNQHINVPGVSEEFHTYTCDWGPSHIRFYVDGELYHDFANTQDIPYHHDFFIIMNVAMGGGFGGAIDPNFVSSTMEVDYVRVYQ